MSFFRFRRRVCAPIAALLAACTFPRPPDVSDDVPIDAAVDARPDLVRGRWIHTWTVGPSFDEGDDVTALTFQAVVPMDGEPGGFVTRTGVGRTDGTFEIEGVPPGVTYLLKANRLYFVTDQHELTVRTTLGARGGQQYSAAPTPVTFTLTNLPPTVAGDSVELESLTLALDNSIAAPPVGQTSLTIVQDWNGTALPTADRGDDLALVLRRRTAATASTPRIDRIVASAAVPAPNIVDGQPTAFDLAFTEPTGTFFAGSSNRAAFEAGHTPIAARTTMSVRCAAIGATSYSWLNGGAFLSGLAIVSATQSDWRSTSSMTLTDAFPDPYPASLQRLCSQEYVRERPMRAPGATTTRSIDGGAFRIRPVEQLISAPLAPPSAIRIAGQDAEAGGLLVNDGEPIQLTWSAVAQATQYEVLVYQITRSGVSTQLRVAAFVETDQARLTLPALVFSGSEFIAFEVTAFSTSNQYAAGDLQGAALTGASATAVTAMFRYSATCGNGTVDLGEDCDGASASCDVDCTAAMCGDGTRNAAAGEICDSIEDTIGCDSDCTPNVCGDGHLNVNTEQCDDGGTTSGDGCSASCRSE